MKKLQSVCKSTTMAIGIRLELASNKYRKSPVYFDINY